MIYFKRILLLISVLASSVNVGYGIIRHNTEQCGIVLPYKIEKTTFVLESISNNSDGTAEIILYNDSDILVKSFFLEITTEADVLCFESTMLPQYGMIKISEREGKMFDTNILFCNANSSYWEKAGNDGMLKVLKNMNTVEIQNILDYSIYNIDIFIKERTDSYYLNRTFKMTIRELKGKDTVKICVPFTQYEIVYLNTK